MLSSELADLIFRWWISTKHAFDHFRAAKEQKKAKSADKKAKVAPSKSKSKPTQKQQKAAPRVGGKR